MRKFGSRGCASLGVALHLAPGAAARAGFGSAELRARHPRLITCDITGYGDQGPYAEMKAYDLLVQAESGLAAITGAPERPGRVGVSVADIGAGMYAYSAILEALLTRARTGTGEGLAVSLFDAMAEWMTVPLLFNDYGGKAPERVGLAHPSIAPYGLFATGDGGALVISIQNEREWRALCADVLGQPAMADHPDFRTNTDRVRNRAKLDAEVAAIFRRHPTPALREKLLKAGVAFGALNEVADLSRHPQLRRMTVATPSGPVDLPAPPARRARPPQPGPIPALGAHTDAIRKEFGG